MRAALVPTHLSEDEETIHHGQPVFMDYEEEKKSTSSGRLTSMALLQISWLAPSIRRAVLRQLGIDEKKERAEALHFMLADLKTDKAEMRAKGIKGIKGGALAHLAKIKGVSIKTLKQRLYRWRRLQKKSQR